MSTDLSALIEKKFKQLVDFDIKQHEKKLTDIFKLQFLFNFYETQIKKVNDIADELIEQNATIKSELTEVIQSRLILEQQLKEVSEGNNAFGGNSKRVDKETSDALFDKMTFAQLEIKKGKQEIESQAKKIQEQSLDCQNLKKDKQMLEQQLKSLRKNEQSFNEDIENLKKQIFQLKKNHQEDKIEYQKGFLKQLEKKMSEMHKIQEENRNRQKTELLRRNDELQEKVKLIVSKVNQMLGITLVGEENTDAWLKQFKNVMEKYHRQIDILVPQRITKQNNLVMNMAHLHKEKIGASRQRLMKIISEQ